MLRKCWPTDARVVEATISTFAAVESDPPPSYDERRGGVAYVLRVEGRESRRVADVLGRRDSVSPGEVGAIERTIGYVVDRAVSRHEVLSAPPSMARE